MKNPSRVGIAKLEALVLLSLCLLPSCGAQRAAEPPPMAPASESGPREEAPGSADKAAPAASDERGPEPAQAPPPAPAPGGGMPRSAARPESEAERGEAGDIDALSGQLDRALSLSAPDCTLSWALRDRLCDLSQRLCYIAGRSAEPEVEVRCRDGRARCERATARVRAACAE